MTKILFGGKGGLVSCISPLVYPSKLIRGNHPNRPKMHKLEKLGLIAEYKKIRRNSGVINVYTFVRLDFEGVEFYAARQYVHLKKEVI